MDISISRAAELLGLKYRTTLRYVREGKLDAHMVGRQWFVDDETLLAFIIERENKAKALRKEKRERFSHRPQEKVYSTIDEAIGAATSGRVKPLVIPKGVSSISKAKEMMERDAGDDGPSPYGQGVPWRWPGGE